MKNSGIVGIIGLLLLLFLAGCSSKYSEIKNVVRNYNLAVAKAYFEDDYVEIRKFASLDEQQQIGQKLKEMRDSGLKMKSELQSTKFIRVDINDDESTVETEEVWSYELLNRVTGLTDSPPKTTKYNAIYTLHSDKIKNKWFVSSVSLSKEEEL